MKFINKAAHRLKTYYRLAVVREQYPMLTRLSRKELAYQEAMGVVYMLHHVAPKDRNRIPTNEDLKVSPQFLEKIILKYQKQGVDMVSLDEVYRRLTMGDRPGRPFVAFTIDDGYLDNYVNAFPVFEKYQVPFAIFVATDFVDRKAVLWWDSLEDLILANESITTADGKCYPCSTYQQRWDTFRILRERILNLDQSNLPSEQKIMFSRYDIDWNEPIRKEAMSWEQVRLLARHPLCTIGGHTISHPALSLLTADEAWREIKGGIDRIARETGQPVSYFAYPYGTPHEIGEREYEMMKDCNIKMAFLAHQGCITANNKHHLTHLPRVYFHQK